MHHLWCSVSRKSKSCATQIQTPAACYYYYYYYYYMYYYYYVKQIRHLFHWRMVVGAGRECRPCCL